MVVEMYTSRFIFNYFYYGVLYGQNIFFGGILQWKLTSVENGFQSMALL